MPFIPKRRYDKLIRAGAMMANLCSNGKQNWGIPKHYRESMAHSQRDWDAALREVRRAEAEGAKKREGAK